MHSFTLRFSAAAALLALAAAPSLAATSGYSETWDGQGNLADWFGSTIHSTVVNPGVGGNPDGHLLIRRGGAFAIGATTDLDAVDGSYAGNSWTVKVDLAQIEGTVSDVRLRYRYQDSTYNGWSFQLAAALGGWSTKSVTFNADWSDADAMLNGWSADAAGSTESFAQTMANTYHPEVRFEGTRTLLVGVDNFSITAVPEPGTYLLMALGLVGVAFSARRRQRG